MISWLIESSILMSSFLQNNLTRLPIHQWTVVQWDVRCRRWPLRSSEVSLSSVYCGLYTTQTSRLISTSYRSWTRFWAQIHVKQDLKSRMQLDVVKVNSWQAMMTFTSVFDEVCSSLLRLRGIVNMLWLVGAVNSFKFVNK